MEEIHKVNFLDSAEGWDFVFAVELKKNTFKLLEEEIFKRFPELKDKLHIYYKGKSNYSCVLSSISVYLPQEFHDSFFWYFLDFFDLNRWRLGGNSHS